MENQNNDEMKNQSIQAKEYNIVWTEGHDYLIKLIKMKFPLTVSLHDVYEFLRKEGHPLPDFETFNEDNLHFPDSRMIEVRAEFKNDSSSSSSKL